jgi:ABC-type phosphate transport system auxiliary subunit
MTAVRTKYELTHPVLSIRVSQELYDEIQERRRNGQSYGDILRIGLNKQKAENEHWQKDVEQLTLEILQLEQKLDKYKSQYGEIV